MATFFPAEHRNIILEAGSRQCLLDVVYDGIRRTVEPYSLVYKTRKDGVSSEYFYVYDRTGGRTSNVGIKAFLNNKLQSVRLIEEQFQPRYEIELSKAGEPPAKSYFGNPFSGRTRSTGSSFPSRKRKPTRQVFKGTLGPVYIIECPYCGKTFRRKKQGSKLNKHKDKYGNQCFGKTGYLKEIR